MVYEKELQSLHQNGHYAGLLKTMLNTMQRWLNDGGISLVCRGMGNWTNVLNDEKSANPLAIGLQADDYSLVNDVIEEKSPKFSVHFNQNPKRLAKRENRTEGATLAIPMNYKDKMMAVVLVYDKNPLLFKDSIKHKFINTVRVTALNLPSRFQENPGSLFTHTSGALIPDIWHRTIDTEIKRLKDGVASCHTWISKISLSNISQIRTQHRMQELNLMQQDLVHALNPGKVGIPGLIGYHSDYNYISIIQSEDPKAQDFWSQKVEEAFTSPFELTNSKQINTDVQISTLKLNSEFSEAYDVITQLKKEEVQK